MPAHWRSSMSVPIRVGLNSGAVVVRSIGNDLRMDYTAVGDTTHIVSNPCHVEVVDQGPLCRSEEVN
jgi:class 3 adenylate cyclase